MKALEIVFQVMGNVLKYRSKHQFKSDTEAKYKKYKLGLSYQG